MSKLLIDVCTLLDVCDALYSGNLSTVSTEALEDVADSDLVEDHEKARLLAEIERRRVQWPWSRRDD